MSRSDDNRSMRRLLSQAVIVVGAILLAMVPLYLVLLTVSGTRSGQISGTVLIGSAVGGMVLVLAGSALRS